MSRAQRPEQEFGSDSFLDVIANIVGILIILIVVVGVKVARQPVADPNAMPPAVVTDPDIIAEPAIIDADLPEVERLNAKVLSPVEAERKQEEELTLLSNQAGQLDEQKNSASSELEMSKLRFASLQQQQNRSEKQLTSAESEKLRLSGLLSISQQKLDSANKDAIVASQQIVSLTQQNDELADEMTRTLVETQKPQARLEDLQASSSPRDRLEHRLSPVGEKVEDGEIHFRIDNGRISHIPLTELLERLKSQIQARRSAVMKFSRYEGTVGPVEGYTMNYLVERDRLSTMESVEYGTGGYRVSVSRWTITPDESLRSELVEDAVRPGSRFRQIIDVAAPGSAVTFWIYPDSFSTYPQLREIAHGLQLRVAARPLPPGTPIIGSPGGSKSTAQ